MNETIKTLTRNDLELKWDFTAWKTDNNEFFMVALTKITEPEDEFAKTLGLKEFKTLHAKEFKNFWEAREYYKKLLNNWEEYYKEDKKQK